MTLAWQEMNTTLQIMGHASSQGIYGKGKRRGRKGQSIDVRELLEEIELE